MSVEPGGTWAAERLARWRTAKDAEALGELLKWQRNRAFAVALRILGREAEAEDAVQQAFLKLFRSAPEFERGHEFSAAVYRAVTQCAIDLIRTRQARRVMEQAMAQQSHATASGSPAALVENTEAVRLLQEEMSALAPEDRALLALCCQEGLSVAAAAESLELSRETARDRLARLLADLRRRLARRGVVVSLLLLVGVFQQGRSASATETLCRVLDAGLPGASCATVAPAAAANVTAAAVLAQAGVAIGIVASKILLAATAAVAIAASVVVWSATRAAPAAPETGPSAPPVVVAPVAHAPVPPAVPVEAPAPPVAVPADPDADKEEDKEDEKVPLDQLPAAVRMAAAGAVPGVRLTDADRKAKKGRTVYEIDGEAGGKQFEIRVSPEGKVLKVEEKGAEEEQGEKKGPGKPAVKPVEKAPADF
jgi:RNA polymerase sigma-70 factor (ECF subfamily)